MCIFIFSFLHLGQVPSQYRAFCSFGRKSGTDPVYTGVVVVLSPLFRQKRDKTAAAESITGPPIRRILYYVAFSLHNSSLETKLQPQRMELDLDQTAEIRFERKAGRFLVSPCQ